MKDRFTAVEGDVRGEKQTVECHATVCDRCGFYCFSDRDSIEYGLKVADAYRRKHGLLMGQEIKHLRERLGMSQLAFAEYLGVGSASVKRWEGGLIQDEAMDRLIRLKTDLEVARRNVETLSRLTSAQGMPSGFAWRPVPQLVVTWPKSRQIAKLAQPDTLGSAPDLAMAG
jgi:HTH-type transcriptional regulator/antitoxin MqsA